MNTVPKTQFLLTGFIQEKDDRVFSFDGVGADRVRVPVRVKIDTAMARRYGIRPQELPLLCRSLLDRCPDGPQEPVLTFGEDEMSRHRESIAARVDDKQRRTPRKPVPGAARSPWRTMRTDAV
jgi:hypothetical protein